MKNKTKPTLKAAEAQHSGTLAAFRPQGKRKQKDGHMDAGLAHQATRRSRRWDKTDNWLRGKWPTRRNPKRHASEGSRRQGSLASTVPNLIHCSCRVVAAELLRPLSSLSLPPAKGRRAEGRPHAAPRPPEGSGILGAPWLETMTSLPVRASLRRKCVLNDWTFKTPEATPPPLLQYLDSSCHRGGGRRQFAWRIVTEQSEAEPERM